MGKISTASSLAGDFDEGSTHQTIYDLRKAELQTPQMKMIIDLKEDIHIPDLTGATLSMQIFVLHCDHENGFWFLDLFEPRAASSTEVAEASHQTPEWR
jgi:hypothetical protein